jgi:hypothetical protein
MIQPTKDEIRAWLREARAELRKERGRRETAEARLAVARQLLGELVLREKIAIPVERLGDLALGIAMEAGMDGDEDSPRRRLSLAFER